MDHLAYVACHIEEQISDIDAAAKAQAKSEDEAEKPSPQSSTILSLGNITLRGVRPAIAFQQLEDDRAPSDLAFKDFRLRLQRWITTNVVWDPEGRHGNEFRFHPTDKVYKYSFILVCITELTMLSRSRNMHSSLHTMHQKSTGALKLTTFDAHQTGRRNTTAMTVLLSTQHLVQSLQGSSLYSHAKFPELETILQQ